MLRSLAVTVVVVCAWSNPADACSFLGPPDTRFFRFEAPAGGLWWARGLANDSLALTLVDDDGNEIEVEVVSIGSQGSAALRVPDVAVGTSYAVPDDIQRPSGSTGEERFVVVAGDVVELGDPPAPPVISIVQREIRVGYTSVLVSPIGGECVAAGAPGWWNIQYDEHPFLLVDDPGDGVVLDVQLQLPEASFEDASTANEILFDAETARPVDILVEPPPDTTNLFRVHARVRRIADGAVSDIVTIDVPIDDVPAEERLEFVGCACSSTTPTSLVPALAFLALLRSLRRRGSSAQ